MYDEAEIVNVKFFRPIVLSIGTYYRIERRFSVMISSKSEDLNLDKINLDEILEIFWHFSFFVIIGAIFSINWGLNYITMWKF